MRPAFPRLALPLAATLLAATLLGGAATAGHGQAPETSLLVRRAGTEIGREDFTLQNGRQGGATGTTIVSRIRYPALGPDVEGRVLLERREDGTFAAAQFDLFEGRRERRMLVEAGRQVLRVRTSWNGTESVREMAAGPNVVVLDDSVFALYLAVATLATPEGRALIAVFPRSGRRIPFTARREAGDGAPGERILLAGGVSGTIWLDGQGQLERLVLDSAGTEAQRLRR